MARQTRALPAGPCTNVAILLAPNLTSHMIQAAAAHPLVIACSMWRKPQGSMLAADDSNAPPVL